MEQDKTLDDSVRRCTMALSATFYYSLLTHLLQQILSTLISKRD